MKQILLIASMALCLVACGSDSDSSAEGNSGGSSDSDNSSSSSSLDPDCVTNVSGCESYQYSCPGSDRCYESHYGCTIDGQC
jgi:hypothetical protein